MYMNNSSGNNTLFFRTTCNQYDMLILLHFCDDEEYSIDRILAKYWSCAVARNKTACCLSTTHVSIPKGKRVAWITEMFGHADHFLGRSQRVLSRDSNRSIIDCSWLIVIAGIELMRVWLSLKKFWNVWKFFSHHLETTNSLLVAAIAYDEVP